MKEWHYFLLLFILPFGGTAQVSQTDSLKYALGVASDDTSKVNTLLLLSNRLSRTSPLEAIQYATQARDLAEQLDFQRGLAYALKSIGMSYYFEGNYIEVLVYWQQSLDVFKAIGDKLGVANILNNLGAVHFSQGDDNKAVEYYLESLRVSEEIGDKLRIATALVNIGAVYNNKQATHEEALQYYRKSLPLSEELGDYDAIGTSAVNIGTIYLERNEADSALFYFEKALVAYRQTETGNVPYALYNIGQVYAQREDFQEAIRYQQEAYELAKRSNSRLEMAQSLLGLANTYEEMGDIRSAISRFLEAQNIAEEIGASYELINAYEGLALAYARSSDFQKAFDYHQLFSSIKDTLYNAENDKRIQALTLGFDIEKKQGQIDLLTKDKALQDLRIQRQKTITYAAGITGALLLLLAIGLYNRYKYVRKTKKIIEGEKALSEKLLLNILPHETAEELKIFGFATPKHYDMVSVLFTDFKGFTKIAEKLTPQELVEELNQCFLEFDRIIDKYNLEKIKTIGDAYMCAGGIPVPNTTNPVDIVKAALEITRYMEDLRRDRESRGKDYWELRLGIHTGPVIAGVVGKNKFAYDIWGDAVNTASRMESSGIPGKVNISGSTYELIKDHFICTHRGKIQAKNKGEIDMYIVEGMNGVAGSR
jgi:class 3 adenylate cyclase